MSLPADRRAVVAVDLGAQSCRVSLLRWPASGAASEGPTIQLVHRIANGPVKHDGQLRWNLQKIEAAADEGLRRCADLAEEGIAAVGVTGWAVDYVRLPAAGPAPLAPIAAPFSYRDTRTAAALEAFHRRLPAARLYQLTGIQVLPINTVYQLVADGMAGVPAHLPWLNLPEYMLYRWGARPVAEYTNATHTAMVDLKTGQWSPEIFSAAGLDLAIAPEIVAPGTVVGKLRGPLAALPALRDTLLIAPACHDTASAIAGIPAHGDDWAYISSGTWSLVGTVLDRPCAGEDAARMNFTNEGGVGGRFCFLRNVNGLWLLTQCMEDWHRAGEKRNLRAVLDAAAKLPTPSVLLDVDDPELLVPGHMPGKILAQLQRRQAAVAESSPPAIAALILHSLAARYAEVLQEAETLTGKRFERLYIVGGGSKNEWLTGLTRQATGLECPTGEPESSTIGNFAVQLAALEQRQSSGAIANGVEHDAVARWAGLLFGGFPGDPSPAAPTKPNQA